MPEIFTSNGFTILVSEKDFDWASSRAWFASAIGKLGTRYAVRSESRNRTHKSFYMHREIAERMGMLSEKDVDHINRDSLDNRRENLRMCSRSQNAANSYRNKEGKQSRFKGVYKVKKSLRNPWGSHITCNYKSIYLGVHPTAEAAAKRYDEAAREIFGEHAALNFPDQQYAS